MIHTFDPVLFELPFGVIYWYGARFSLGFLGLFLWFRWRARHIGLTPRDVYLLSILLAVGILIGGRAFDILVYEFDYYREDPLAALNWWKGGMASHGGLLGGTAAIYLFSRWSGRPFLVLLDEIVVPAALLLAFGRIGNFIVGGVIGVPTDLPWGVVYPDVEGARHPVALYESAKNFLIVPMLVAALRAWPSGRGIVMSLFVVLYGGLRFLVDLLRDYEATWLGMDTGQVFNLAMTVFGLGVLLWFAMRPAPVAVSAAPAPVAVPAAHVERRPALLLKLVFLALVIYPLGIPNSWTKQNIETRRQGAGQVEVVDPDQ